MLLLYTLVVVAGAQAAAIPSDSFEDLTERTPFNATLAKRVVPSPTCVTTQVGINPPHTYCGATGALSSRNLLFRTILSGTNELEQCRDKCLAQPACVSFAYNSGTQRCRGFASTLTNQGIQVGSSNGNVFYDKKCFKTVCTPVSCVDATLDAPVALTGWTGGTATSTLTGNVVKAVPPLPFPVGYGLYSTNQVYMNLQGYLSTAAPGSPAAHLEWAPFSPRLSTPSSPRLEIQLGKDEGLFYSVDGVAPNRVAKFEWRVTSSAVNAERYDVTLQLYEADWHGAEYSYLQVTDSADSMQSFFWDSVSPVSYYSNGAQPTKLHTGLSLSLRSDTEVFTVDTLPICSP